MKSIALIPARIGATRFPRKLLAPIKGVPVIVRTYLSAFNSGLFDKVIVVSDSDEIIQEINKIGGSTLKSLREHESGTDRIAEFVDTLEGDIFVNVQGDEPFIQQEPIKQLLNIFTQNKDAQVASLVQELKDTHLINDPNYVKVVLDKDNKALLFSRSPIPYIRDTTIPFNYYEHVGVYAFKKSALLQFTQLKPSLLEKIEKIECLRFLENNIPIHIAITQYLSIEIDTPEDILKAEDFLRKNNLEK